jgi:hypothetical protein
LDFLSFLWNQLLHSLASDIVFQTNVKRFADTTMLGPIFGRVRKNNNKHKAGAAKFQTKQVGY